MADYLPNVPFLAFWVATFFALFLAVVLALALALAIFLPTSDSPNWGVGFPEEGGGYAGNKENGWVSGTPSGLNAGDPSDKMNFSEARAHCVKENRKLPVFPSQSQENEFVKLIKKRKDTVRCKEFFLGYKLAQDQVVYHNFALTKTWPGLANSYDVATPTKDRDCIEYRFDPTRIGRIRPCKEFEMRCVLGIVHEDEEECEEEPLDPDCIRHLINTPRNIFRFHKFYNRTVMGYKGIIPADPRMVPKSVMNEVSKTQQTCYGLAAIMNATFIDIYHQKKPPYRSKRRVKKDYSEKNTCWAMDRAKSYRIKLVPCSKELCVVCV